MWDVGDHKRKVCDLCQIKIQSWPTVNHIGPTGFLQQTAFVESTLFMGQSNLPYP
jgi:hypothetical protein